MLVKTNEIGLNDLPNPANERVKRDRALALAYVAKGQSRTAVSELSAETGVYWRTVYRAIHRQLEWAKTQIIEALPDDAGQG